MKKTPIMFLSDSIDLHSGLARITRGLAIRLASHPSFDVVTLGLGGFGTSKYALRQYVIPSGISNTHAFGRDCFESVWEDAFGPRPGIVMCVWDLSRIAWLFDNHLVKKGLVQAWGYNAIDGLDIAGRLPSPIERLVATQLHRCIAYTSWSAGVLSRLRNEAVPTLPHGLSPEVFRPSDEPPHPTIAAASKVLGVNMTNQPRKQWDLVAMTMTALRLRDPSWHLWAHTNSVDLHWKLFSLFEAAGLAPNKATITMSMSDSELCSLYTKADVLFGAAPEGWGYPLAEAQFCGTPSLAIDAGGNREIASHTVRPVAWRVETGLPIVRPVCNPDDCAEAIEAIVAAKPDPSNLRLRACAKWSWETIWPSWSDWFEGGL